MKWNKRYPYVVILNCLLILFSGAGDPIIIGLYPAILMALLNGIFVIFCTRWQRIAAACFTIIGIIIPVLLVNAQRSADSRLERILKATNSHVETNAGAANPASNAVK